MGCFNVACSISSLSISCGTPTYFIPLLKKYHKSKRYMKANFPDGFGWFENDLSSSICYANDIFNPLCLPIKGIYNDYGGLEEIERDASVESLEKFFGIDIETIIGCSHCSKGIDNYTSEVYQAYRVFKEEHTPFDEIYLKNIGFEYTQEEECFYHPHIKNMKLKIIPEEVLGDKRSYQASYIIYNKDNKVIVERNNSRSTDDELKKDVLRHFSYYLNIKKEDQIAAGVLFNISGMFIHGDIYDYMSRKTTFSSWSGEVDIEEAYEEYANKVKEYVSVWDAFKKELGKDNSLEIHKHMWELTNPFSSHNHGDFIGFFKDWEFLEEIYKNAILEDKLKKQFVAYCSFYNEMMHMNRFLFPGCNGLQHGNPFASKRLLEKALEVVNKEIEETREQFDEEEEYDESCIC